MNINQSLTESDNKKSYFISQLEHQIQIQETKDSGWIFDRRNSLRIRFYKTDIVNGSAYVKFQLRPNAILNKENID